MPRISSAKTAPIVANWRRCSGRQSAFAPASTRTHGPFFAGIGTAIAGRRTPGEAADLDKAGGEHRARVPRRDDRGSLSVGDRFDGADEGAVLLRAQHVGRLLVHPDDLRRLDELEPARVESRGAEDDGLDAVGARREGAFDHGLGAAVSSHRVDGNPAHGRRAYGAWV